MKTKIFLITLLVAVSQAIFQGGCKDEDVRIIGLCPLVVSTDPTNLATGVPLNKVVTATFNEKMDPATFTAESFTLYNGARVAGAVTFSNATVSFTPSTALTPNKVYTGTVKAIVKDFMGNTLQEDYVWTFTTIPEIKLSSNPEQGGTTSGAGTFTKNSQVTVVASPNPGYSFANWTEGETVVSTESNYQFTMDGNRSLVANFTSQFVVNILSSPVEGGTTTGAGTYDDGTTVTVTAVPNSDYTFIGWTENGSVVSLDPNYEFIVNENKNLVANFAINAYTLNVIATNGTVVKNPNQTSYNSGTVVQLTATPNTGYTFTGWSGDATGTNNPLSITMNSNKNITANFTAIPPTTYTLNVTAVNGTVVKNPNQTSYNSGTVVQLTATPNTGYTFTGWSGDATGTNNPLSVTMNSNKNITANFTAIPPTTYTLNVTAVNGTVVKNPNQTSYNSGTVVQLTATPNTGYTFTGWSGDATGTNNPLSVTMNSNKNITANFTTNEPIGPGKVDLKSAGDFVILTKSGISTTGNTSITGNIGVSPAAATAITGFGLIMDINGQSSHTPIVSGKVYAADYAAPTPAKLTTAVNDMETAFTTANGLTTPAPIVDLYAGDISGRTLPAGLYKWSTGVLITSAGVTLSGGPNDTWVFQIAQNLTINNSAAIKLVGGAKAENIFWVVSGQATLGTNSDVKGIILSQTLISLNTGAKVTGLLLAQTAVTLNASTVVKP